MNVKWNVFVITYILLTNTNVDELNHSPEIPYFFKTIKWSPHGSETDSNIRIFVPSYVNLYGALRESDSRLAIFFNQFIQFVCSVTKVTHITRFPLKHIGLRTLKYGGKYYLLAKITVPTDIRYVQRKLSEFL